MKQYNPKEFEKKKVITLFNIGSILGTITGALLLLFLIILLLYGIKWAISLF
jgi:hypothetical protein